MQVQKTFQLTENTQPGLLARAAGHSLTSELGRPMEMVTHPMTNNVLTSLI